MNISELEKIAKKIRRDAVTMVYNAKAGHPGGSLSATDLLVALYYTKIKVDPKKPKDSNRDRFIYSKGHASPGLYAVLASKGFFPEKEFKGFRKLNTLLQGHVEEAIPGVDFSAGSLGQGFSFANGVALAGKLDKKDYKVYVFLGDGETQEGEVWEAAMTASNYNLDNMVVIVDRNHIQNDDFVEKTKNIEPLDKKFESFGFEVFKIDGHNMEAIVDVLKKADLVKGKPTCIIAETIKGKGVSFMENNPKFHGAPPSDEEYKQAMEELK